MQRMVLCSFGEWLLLLRGGGFTSVESGEKVFCDAVHFLKGKGCQAFACIESQKVLAAMVVFMGT